MSMDILLDERFQPAVRANGDAALAEGNTCILQMLRMEAAGNEGDYWYMPEWGWSLLDFKGKPQDELTKLEIEQRIRQKLSAHEEIAVETIAVTADWLEDSITIKTVFRLLSDSMLRRLNFTVGATQIEVIDLA